MLRPKDQPLHSSEAAADNMVLGLPPILDMKSLGRQAAIVVTSNCHRG